MKKESEDKTQGTKSFQRFDLLIAFLCGLLILACFISSFFPKSRLWGINHLAYFPLWVRLLFTILGLSILIPWFNSKVYNLFDKALSFFQRIIERKKVLGYTVLSLVFMLFFWLLKTRTYFLGDSYSMILQLESEKYMRTGFEFLENLVHLYGFKFLRLFFIISAGSTYIILSILAGGVFIFILFFFTRAFSEDRFDRFFIFAILLFSGAAQLFLGYAEQYTLTYVSIFAYLYFSLKYLQGKVRICLPILFCVLSTGFHLSSAYLLPSLFFLFILKKKKGELVFSLKKAIPYLFILIFLFILFICYVWSFNPALSEIFIPVLKGRPEAPGYTLFSFSHLLDILNQHLLLSSIGVILLLSIIIIYKKKIKFKDPIIGFLIIISMTQLSYHFLVDPKLGAGRDWDLFSALATGYTFLGIYLFINLIRNKRYSSIVLVFTAFFTILPWFLLNANTERSIDRFNILLDLDLKRSLGGRQILIQYYAQQKMFFEVKQIKTDIYKIFPEDSLNRMATDYNNIGEYDKAIELLKKAIELNPDYVFAYRELGRAYLQQKRIDEALEVLQKVVRLKPYISGSHVNVAYALLEKGKPRESLAEFKKAEKIGGIEPGVYGNIAYIYLTFGETEKALKYYKKSLKMDPANYNVHFGLGQTYLTRNSPDEALDEFERVVSLKSDFTQAYYYLGMIYSRKGLKEKAIENYDLFLRYSKDEAQNEEVRALMQQLRSQSP
jgi:tetratricopeptide (TPR) repeat protein